MKVSENYEEILIKIEEMREFFRIGDEILPFLSDLFKFVKEVVPLLSHAISSITDTKFTLPDAKDRIIDVNKTTEMATQEILDRLENVFKTLEYIEKETTKENFDKIERLKDDLMNIMYALQFQDITAQKLEHANEILTAINQKFTELFKKIRGIKIKTKVGKQIIAAIEAEMQTEGFNRLSEEFKNKIEDKVRHKNISQEDIDNIFKSGDIE
ncbi:MAG: hypothetical protein H0Z29_03495 [Candidatus Marinimicrobia bacterium]|nr:hypothetical protein [Candidatus Neomarinimicrobiota bacterium]